MTAVNVMDIVDARSLEITEALEAMRTQCSISYKLAIPFYMRRRAASHNPARLPARFRPVGCERKKTKCRWKKKKKKKEEGEEGGGPELLETHLWHAKRCHMVDLWGHRLPLTTTQKGERAQWRAARDSATVQDISFYHWWEVTGEELEEILPVRPCRVALDRAQHATLYTGDEAQGPVTLLWLDKTRVLVCSHPALTPDWGTLRAERRHFQQFTLNGQRAVELLVRALDLDGRLGELGEDPYSHHIARGVVFGGEVRVPERVYRVHTSLLDGPVRQPTHSLNPSLDHGTAAPLLSSPTIASDSPPPERVPYCLYRDPRTASLVLTLPAGLRNRFLVALVYSGGRITGLSDSHSIATHNRIPHFPEDYPDAAGVGRSVGGEGPLTRVAVQCVGRGRVDVGGELVRGGEVVGRITSGGFGFSSGCGAGIGVVRRGENLEEGMELRNVKSGVKRAVRVEMIEEGY